jgi:hypothetical protein
MGYRKIHPSTSYQNAQFDSFFWGLHQHGIKLTELLRRCGLGSRIRLLWDHATNDGGCMYHPTYGSYDDYDDYWIKEDVSFWGPTNQLARTIRKIWGGYQPIPIQHVALLLLLPLLLVTMMTTTTLMMMMIIIFITIIITIIIIIVMTMTMTMTMTTMMMMMMMMLLLLLMMMMNK